MKLLQSTGSIGGVSATSVFVCGRHTISSEMNHLVKEHNLLELLCLSCSLVE